MKKVSLVCFLPMRAHLVVLSLVCLPAFGAGSDMQWQAPRILPPKGEAVTAAAGAAGSAASAASAPATSSAASVASKASALAAATTAKPAASASAKASMSPELASKIKEKLEQTQQPAPKHPRPSESRSSSSFMTQEEFRARLAAAAANAKQAAPVAAPKPAKLRSAKPVVHAPPPKPARGSHWSYSGEDGPEHWGELGQDWARCGNGQRQSPIDIRDGLKLELEPPLFEYQASRFAVLDNGHTVQVNLQSPNFTSLMGRRYQLVQFHFHRPSEERIEGRGFEMVVHLVHKDDEGRLLVVAVMVERGEPNAQVQAVWNNLPLEKHESLNAQVALDMAQLLPARREYYTYMGSLTTPPCSEGVLWVVMKQPITFSEQQMRIFARLYPMNARPLQAAGDRLIKESN